MNDGQKKTLAIVGDGGSTAKAIRDTVMAASDDKLDVVVVEPERADLANLSSSEEIEILQNSVLTDQKEKEAKEFIDAFRPKARRKGALFPFVALAAGALGMDFGDMQHPHGLRRVYEPPKHKCARKGCENMTYRAYCSTECCYKVRDLDRMKRGLKPKHHKPIDDVIDFDNKSAS